MTGTANGMLGPGQWLWRTSQESAESADDTPFYACQSWLFRQRADRDLQTSLSSNSPLLPSCPCLFDFVSLDPRFTASLQQGCALTSFPLRGRTFAQASLLVSSIGMLTSNLHCFERSQCANIFFLGGGVFFLWQKCTFALYDRAKSKL